MQVRARKLYTSARIYELKFGKGEWKLPFASPTGRVVFFGFVIIFEEKKELTSMFYSLQKQRKHSEERSFRRFKMSLKCDRMFTLVRLIFELNTGTHWKFNSALGFWKYKADVPDFISVYENGGQSDYRRIPQATTGYHRIPWYWRF